MAKRLFIGSLPYSCTNAQLEELFAQAGKVSNVSVITDRISGQGKGFAFVEMMTDEEADNAIKMFNNYSLDGRTIVVNVARPKEDRPAGGGGNFNNSNRGRNDFSRSNKRW